LLRGRRGAAALSGGAGAVAGLGQRCEAPPEKGACAAEGGWGRAGSWRSAPRSKALAREVWCVIA